MEPIKKIVLIDDEPGVLIALKLMLQIKGFVVQDFVDSEKGLNFILENASDHSETAISYILCDLRMPQKSGLDVLKETRNTASHIPFFLMSGHADEAEQKQAIELGASAFVGKPFDLEEFMSLCQQVS